jgi:hypothetical protein
MANPWPLSYHQMAPVGQSVGKIKIWENTFTLSNYQLICNIVFKLLICVMQCLNIVDKNNDKIRIKKKNLYTLHT